MTHAAATGAYVLLFAKRWKGPETVKRLREIFWTPCRRAAQLPSTGPEKNMDHHR